MNALNDRHKQQNLFQTADPTDPVVEELNWITKFKGPVFRFSDCSWIFRFPNCGQRSGYIELEGIDFYWTSCLPWDFLQLSAEEFNSDGQKIGHIGICLAPKQKTVSWFRFRYNSKNGSDCVMVKGETKRFDVALAQAVTWDFAPRQAGNFEWFRVGEDRWEVDQSRNQESFSLSVSISDCKKWNWSSRTTPVSAAGGKEDDAFADGCCETIDEAMAAAANSIAVKVHAAA